MHISRTIQFKIFDYLILFKLFQRLGRRGRDTSYIPVAIVFVEIQQILPDNMHILERSTFNDL